MARIFDKTIVDKGLLYWLIFFFFGLSLPLVAQEPDAIDKARPGKTTSKKDSLKKTMAIIDTMPITYYYSDSENKLYPFLDTTLGHFLHLHDPARRRVFEWLNLGNTGSPVRPLLFNGIRPLGIDWGFHQFDLYYNSVDSLPFYHLGRALTDTYFSFKGQDNSVFRAKFSRQFQDGLQFSLNYQKINQFGQFLSQTAKVSSLATGIQYKHPKKRYTAYLTMSSNSAQVKDNGGLTTDTLFFQSGFERPETQPIRLTAAQTRQATRKYQLYHHYNLGNIKNGNHLSLQHKLWLSNQTYTFFDNNKILDTVFYDTFLTDARGVRQGFTGRTIGNDFAISFKGRRADSTAFEWLPTMGISMVHYDINQRPFTHKETHISLTGKWNLTFGKIFSLQAKGQFGLIGYSGDYLVSGILDVRSKRVGKWQFSADFQAVTPSLLAQRNYITDVLVWENSFNKEFVNRIGVRYNLSKYKLSAGATFSLLTNHVYYGQKGHIFQANKTIPITQIFFRKAFKVRKFHLTNDLLYQRIDTDIIKRPALYLNQQLYWKGFLFAKTMQLKVGIGHRFFNTWQPESYQPAIGQFVLQDSITSPSIAGIDVFANFQVSTFRFFAKMENVNYYWDKRIFAQTALYPQFRPSFRLGIAWLFRD